MHTFKLANVSLLIVTLASITACGNSSKVEQKLIGTWQGIATKTNFSWCVQYKPDGVLELTTHQELIIPRPPPNKESQITMYSGDWSVRIGNRLRHNLLTKAKYRNNKNLLADQEEGGDYSTADYIIGRVDDTSMQYRWLELVDGEEQWFESARVDSCSEKFDLSAQ